MDSQAFRPANPEDMDWIYALFRSTMKNYIEQTWGWDELFQKHGFNENLPASSFVIATLNGEDIGAYSLMEKTDHLWLEMLLVQESFQKRGLGTDMVRTLQGKALAKNKSLRLSVLKVNPATAFYQKLGFLIRGEDRWSWKLEWVPQEAL